MRAIRIDWALLACALAACSSQAANEQSSPFPAVTSGNGAGAAAAGNGAGGAAALAGAAGAAPSAGSGGALDASAGSASAGSTGNVAGGAGAGVGVGVGGGGAGAQQPDARGIFGHPDPNTQYPSYEGFTPYLIEEFNQPLDLDTDPNWTYGDGALYEGMTRMVKQNIAFSDGKMSISVTDTPQPGAYSFSAADNVADKPLSSGELRTIYNNFRYGRYEVRMKAPSSGSNYIFTMFAYRTPAYLLWREIDIEVQASPQNSFISNLITAEAGTRVWSPNIEDSTTAYPYGNDPAAGPVPAAFNTQSDFHTYAFEWLPTSVKWFIDGQLIRTKLDGVGKNSLPIPKISTKIVMNMWVFTNEDLGGGDPTLNQYPITGQYDWFRFYRWNQDTMYPCGATPGCLPEEDLTLAKNNQADPLPDKRPDLCTGADGMRTAPCGQ